MPLCVATADEPDDDAARAKASARAVERELRRLNSLNNNVKRMLLLGAGESGKSTIFKQMKVMSSGGYTDDERSSFKWIVHRNVIDGIQTLLRAADKMGLEVSDENADRADQVLLWEGENLNEDLASGIRDLWADEAVQVAFKRRAEFQLGDATKYFLDSVERVGADSYLPTTEDVLNARVRTSGVVSKDFLINLDGAAHAHALRVYDVGGQRSERSKWIHYFDHVETIIFVAALSEFDQVLAEDQTKNRLSEAMDLFEQITHSHYFQDKSVFLFFNKRDLFEEKISKVDPKPWFPDYEGGCDSKAAADYFRSKFDERLNVVIPGEPPRKERRQLYSFLTCATDTGNMRFVFRAIEAEQRKRLESVNTDTL